MGCGENYKENGCFGTENDTINKIKTITLRNVNAQGALSYINIELIRIPPR